MKIKDCTQNGAGTCRNEELIEELLEACRAWINIFADSSQLRAMAAQPNCPLYDALKMTDAAIAKAQGETEDE